VAVDLPAIVVDEGTTTTVATMGGADLRAARAFRDATGFSLVVPKAAPVIAPVVDPDRPARIARIESTLHAARGPLELGDAEALPSLRGELAVAYTEARAHPEDPEAPLLLAEILRTMARAEDLAGDPIGASALRGRATLLDGGRRIGLSEGASGESKEPQRTIVFAIEPQGAIATVDGLPLKNGAASLADGEHHLRVTDDRGTTLTARWIVVSPQTTTLAITAGAAKPPCTREELAAAARETHFTVTCTSWAIVRRTKSALEVRICGATTCAQPTHWVYAVPVTTPPIVEEKSLFRSPWTWVAIGAAAVAGGTIAAWRLGAFERPDAPPPTWRWERAH
jgi:hypothetical protein